MICNKTQGSLFLFLLLLVVHIKAQDPTFSQFYANRAYLNPAFVGMQSGLSLNASHRSQWMRVPRPYITTSATMELKPCHWPSGIGFSLYQDIEGEGLYTSTGGNLTYSHVFVIREGQNVHFGMRYGFTQKSVNFNSLHFSDEIDPVYGFINPTAAISIADGNRVNVHDFDFGVVYRLEFNPFIYIKKNGEKAKRPGKFRHTKIKAMAGFSYNHTFQPLQSLYGLKSNLPRRVTFHGGIQIPFAARRHSGTYRDREENKYFVMPNFRMDFQWSKTYALTQTYAWGAYLQTPFSFYLGGFYQHTNFRHGEFGGLEAPSFIVVAGFETRINDEMPMIVGVSYDAQPLGLPVGVSGGSVELSFRFYIEDPNWLCSAKGRNSRWNKKVGRYIMDCNKFF